MWLCIAGELRKLLASYVVGNGIKNGGYMRKITPTSAEPVVPDSSQSQQKLQVIPCFLHLTSAVRAACIH